jgi:hypothetical protein
VGSRLASVLSTLGRGSLRFTCYIGLGLEFWDVVAAFIAKQRARGLALLIWDAIHWSEHLTG